MRKKPVSATDITISKELLDRAKRAIESEPSKLVKCSVCGSEGAPVAEEPLCWVCRRLKISAWRDNDLQISAQE